MKQIKNPYTLGVELEIFYSTQLKEGKINLQQEKKLLEDWKISIDDELKLQHNKRIRWAIQELLKLKAECTFYISLNEEQDE